MIAAPRCSAARDMLRLDGHAVCLVGIYRKKWETLTMPRPGRPAPDPEFRGYVAIELEGSPEDYDSTLDPGSPTLVQLGLDRRPPEEIERFLGKPVQVQGRLVIDADRFLPEEALERARPSAMPVLVEPGAVAESR
jgi:hypothetical protein